MATTKKTESKQAETKKASAITTPDRVAALKIFFQDYASGKGKGASYKDELESASELHLLVALEAAGKTQTAAKWKSAIKKAGNVDVVNRYIETPLHWAAVSRADSMIEMLVQHGANVNAMSDYGTPLHYQSTMQWGTTNVQHLLYAGADPLLRNKQRKTPVNFVDRWAKKYFNQYAAEAKAHILSRKLESSASPSLPLDQMRNAIRGALKLYEANFEHEGTPRYYLQKNGVSTLAGSPYCRTCEKSFNKDTAYAKHMMSLEHILKEHGTTEEAMLEARAYLEVKDAFSSLYHGRISMDEALKDYPE